MTSFFDGIPTISYDPQADHDFAYRSYNPDEMLMGKTMAEHLRFAVAYWHSFASVSYTHLTLPTTPYV